MVAVMVAAAEVEVVVAAPEPTSVLHDNDFSLMVKEQQMSNQVSLRGKTAVKLKSENGMQMSVEFTKGTALSSVIVELIRMIPNADEDTLTRVQAELNKKSPT